MDFIAVTVAVLSALRKQSERSQVQVTSEDQRQDATPVNYVSPPFAMATPNHRSDLSTVLSNGRALNGISPSRGVPVRIAPSSTRRSTQSRADHTRTYHSGPSPPVHQSFFRVGGRHQDTRSSMQAEQGAEERRVIPALVVPPPRYFPRSPPPPYHP